MEYGKDVTITATMTEAQAEAMAQFFKRAGHVDYERNANPHRPNELMDMKRGANRFRDGLAAAGFDPA